MKNFAKKLVTYFGLVGAILILFAFEKVTRDGVYEILSPWDQEWSSWKVIIFLSVILPAPILLFSRKEIKQLLEDTDEEQDAEH